MVIIIQNVHLEKVFLTMITEQKHLHSANSVDQMHTSVTVDAMILDATDNLICVINLIFDLHIILFDSLVMPLIE